MPQASIFCKAVSMSLRAPRPLLHIQQQFVAYLNSLLSMDYGLWTQNNSNCLIFRPMEGQEVSVPTNQDLADILGSAVLHSENVHFWDFVDSRFPDSWISRFKAYGPMVYRVQNRPPLLHGLIDSLECCNHLWAHVHKLETSDVVDLNVLRRSLEIREGFNWTIYDERPSGSAAPLGNLRMLALGLKATCHRHADCSMMISSHKGVDKITASMHLHRNSHSEKFYSCQGACHSMCSCIRCSISFRFILFQLRHSYSTESYILTSIIDINDIM